MINYQTSKLQILDSESLSWGEVFINDEELEQKGSLIILVEIDFNNNEARHLVTEFIRIAYSSYKQSIGNSPEKILEDILHQLNKNLVQVETKEKNWFKKINAIVGLLYGNSLNFSPVGDVSAYLIREATFSDLIKEKVESQSSTSLFTTIISGELGTNDAFLFTTPTLLDYISDDKIRKFINTLPPLSAVENFKNLLTSAPPNAAFMSIIVKQRNLNQNQETSTSKKIITYQHQDKTQPAVSEKSINTLLDKQKQTASMIKTPSFGQTITTNLKRLLTKIKISKKQSSLFKLSFSAVLLGLLKVLKTVGKGIYRFFSIILSLMATDERRSKTIEKLNKSFAKISIFIKNLNKVKKISGAIILIVLLALSINLVLASRKHLKTEDEREYLETMSQIQSLQDTIEASLIYNDQNRAEENLQSLLGLINSLPTNTKERQKNFANLQETSNILTERVWKIINVPSPVALINLETNEQNDQPKLLQIINDRIIAISNSSFWTADLNDLTVQKNSLSQNFNLENSTKNSDVSSFIAWTEDQKLLTWENQALEQKEIQYSPAAKDITDLALFSSSIYVLDSGANQIYKHQPTSGGYGPGLPWIKETAYSVANCQSLAIDGNIYVLQKDGRIQKYLSGKKQDFDNQNVFPYFNNAEKIFTDEDINNIYILDPSNNRMVIFDKDGNFLKQYTSDYFDNLRDFVVKEKDKKIYLLNGQTIYVISIN